MKNNENKQKSDVAQDAARIAKKKIINKIKSAILSKLMLVLGFIFVKILPIILIVSLVVVIFSWIIELFQAEDTADTIYAQLLNSDIISSQEFSSLVEIKGDEKNGYHLEFKEGFDEKCDKVVEELKKTPKTVVSVDKDLLKQMIKAELVTQYPNLGGSVSGTDQFQGAVRISRITPDKKYGEIKNTSSGETTKQNISFSGSDSVVQPSDGEKIYKIGIMASHSTDDPGARSPTPKENEMQLKEEELTVKVAKYIEQAFRIYGNIQVVQIGSTEEKPNVSNDGRLQKAKDEQVDVLIEIAFNSAGDGTKYENDNGVSITYNQDGGSEETKKLGQKLKENVANSMDLNKSISDSNETTNTLGTKDDSFLSLKINGGYLTSRKDYAIISQDLGLQLYAKGVINGILEYYGIENHGYGTMIDGKESISSTINSKVVELKYVPADQFEKDLTENPTQALQEYTLDENFKIVTATWSYTDDTLSVTKNNSTLDYKSIMSKYTMPMEYMLFWYIDTQSSDFAYDLGQLALDSQFIIMIEDNITTTKVETTTEESSQTKQQDEDGNYSIETEKVDLHETSKETKTTERVSPKIELIYADTWFMNFENKLVLENNKSEVKANGTVTENSAKSESTNVTTEEWSETETVEEKEEDEEGNEVTVEKEITKKYQKEITTQTTINNLTVSNQYKAGEAEVKGNEQKFVELFKKSSIKGMLTESWLIDLIESNQKTANMVDITNYLIYKATGNDTGVMSFDFSEYAPSSFSTITGIYGNTVQEKVWFALRDAGYSEYAVAGVMGNIERESGFNVNAIEMGSGEGRGLCQWSFGRRKALEDFATENGKEWNDADIQIQFLISELEEGGQCLTYNGYSRNDWVNATSPESAATAFCWSFERPSASFSGMSTRTEAARKYYNEFNGKTKPTGTSVAVNDGDGYTSIYIASSGKQFKEYKQYEGSYKDTPFMPYGGSIKSIGCSITSVSIVLTGYGIDVNPGDLAGHAGLSLHLKTYGVNSSENKDFGINNSESNAIADNITNHLKNGQPVVVEISGDLKAGGATKHYDQHFITVLDINSSGEVYVSDPGSSTTNGWANVYDIVGISKNVIYTEN